MAKHPNDLKLKVLHCCGNPITLLVSFGPKGIEAMVSFSDDVVGLPLSGSRLDFDRIMSVIL